MIGKLTRIFDQNFLEEVEKQPNDRAKANKIIGAISQYIQENQESNPYFYNNLSKQIQQVIDEYKEGRLSEQEKLFKLQSIHTTLLQNQNHQEKQYPKELSNASLRAFYDSLKGIIKELDEENLIALASKIDEIFAQKSKNLIGKIIKMLEMR